MLTIDGLDVPVLEGTWREVITLPGSRGRTETGVLRSVRTGDARSEYTGASLFLSRADADELRDLLNAPGDRAVSGDLPGRAVVCESEAGPVVAVAHRPKSGPTAAWRLDWRLIEAP